ncbi:hypothetical protein PAPHI01_2226 [Pancytospora philotis]|nr:hypothetical protein PAPHI01_2226 [Pancytospora philotis]
MPATPLYVLLISICIARFTGRYSGDSRTSDAPEARTQAAAQPADGSDESELQLQSTFSWCEARVPAMESCDSERESFNYRRWYNKKRKQAVKTAKTRKAAAAEPKAADSPAEPERPMEKDRTEATNPAPKRRSAKRRPIPYTSNHYQFTRAPRTHADKSQGALSSTFDFTNEDWVLDDPYDEMLPLKTTGSADLLATPGANSAKTAAEEGNEGVATVRGTVL